MKISLIGSLILSMCLLFGCTNSNANMDDNDSQERNTQPIHYETKREHMDRLDEHPETIGEQGGYPQSDQRDTNGGKYEKTADPYGHDTREKIYNQITALKEIKQAQIEIRDDKVMVALMLNDYEQQNLRGKIEKTVHKYEPNKKLVIYTDDIHWNRMKNEQSRLKAPDGHANGPSTDHD